MIPISLPSDVIRGWRRFSEKVHAQTDISADFAVLMRRRML
jgi:hypothetical protein